VDVATAFSGTVYGGTQVLPASLSGYAITKIVALITKEEQSFQQWTYVFWILAGANLFGFLFCLIFTNKVGVSRKITQKWKNYKMMDLRRLHIFSRLKNEFYKG
jgi:hypothetical protein